MANPKSGDIVEVRTSRGLAYAQLKHKHRTFGSLIRLIDGFHESRPSDLEALAAGCTRFVTFFPLGAAVRRGFVVIIGNASIPVDAKEFPVFRDGVADPKTKSVAIWWLWDGEKEWRVGTLTDQQKKYPIRAVWNDTLLVSRLESGWTPEDADW
jgi:hypothetical protein